MGREVFVSCFVAKACRFVPNYQQDQRLDEVIDQALDTFFKRELSNCGDAVLALKHLSGKEAVRFLTIHKCKGLEFDKVVILGVEKEMFWVEPQQAIAEYFVAVSRAKTHLVLTWTRFRQRPAGNRKGGTQTEISMRNSSTLPAAIDRVMLFACAARFISEVLGFCSRRLPYFLLFLGLVDGSKTLIQSPLVCGIPSFDAVLSRSTMTPTRTSRFLPRQHHPSFWYGSAHSL